MSKRVELLESLKTIEDEYAERSKRTQNTAGIMFMRIAITLIFVLLYSQLSHAQSLFISSHYDIARETPIIGTNYSYPISENMLIVGFAEMWYNPENYAYPEESWPIFSKHWVTYELTPRFSLSMELEVSRNLAGAWSRSSILGAYLFEPDRWHAQPKIGASFRVL
ncbi:MAG: hypothetical protein WDZ38_08330 [Balneolaceae bacterium]